MKTAVIYARYSSEKQTEQSIEGQLRVCNKYAEDNDMLVVDTYIDRAISGKTDNRSRFQKMLKDSAKQAWDIVLVYKLDRFSRNKYEMAMHKKTLKDNGIKLVSAMENIPDTPEGIILESLLEGMAEYYSVELAQKVTRGMNESRQKGQFTGGKIVYGYKVENKKVLIEENESQIVKYVFEQYAADRFVKDILVDLIDKGISNRDKPFTKSSLYKLLNNEKYSGICRHNEEVFTNIYPKIVPDDVYNIVRAKIEQNRFGKHNPEVSYLLKDKIRCGYCKKSIASESGTARDKSVKRYYKCIGRKNGTKCRKKPIKKEILEQLVIDTTLKIFDNTNTLSNIAEKILSTHKQRMADQSLLNIFEKEKHDTKRAIDNLIKCMEQGIVTSSTKSRLEELERSLEDIELKIQKEQTKEKFQITKEDIMRFIRTNLKKEPKIMIKMLIKEIILYDDKMEIYYNYVDKRQYPDDDGHQDFCLHKDEFEMIVDDHKIKTEPYLLHIDIYTYI